MDSFEDEVKGGIRVDNAGDEIHPEVGRPGAR
jgi:hypothetical protein